MSTAKRSPCCLFASAALAVVEELERRRLLSLDCQYNSGTNEYDIYGHDSVNDSITAYYDGVNSQVYIKEGTTEVCRQGNVSNLKIYGGSGLFATSTGADGITIDSSMPSNIPTTLRGQDGNDTLRGGAAADDLDGQADNDSVYGGGNADLITGDGGTNYMNGEAGDDLIFSGFSNGDSIYGGDGNDSITGSFSADQIDGAASPPSLALTSSP
jgi:Ca2+-binding RTX toxin-like protein